MTPLDAAALVTMLALLFHRLVCSELDKADAADLRRCGIVIVRERALDGHSPAIGDYMGHAIWATVTFRGLVYRFDRIQPARKKEELAAGELFLDPGLVYVVGA